MQWIASTYTLFLAALTLVGGAAGDRFGRLRLFRGGTIILALGSLVCSVAATPVQLIAGRAIQGIGAAFLIPNSLALLSASFPKAERGRVIGIWSAWTALTGAGAPILGGWLVDVASWRAGFLSVVPFALATLAVAHRRVPEPPVRRSAPAVDWIGGALATVGLGGVVFAIIGSGASGAGVQTSAAAAAVGLASLIGLGAVEVRSPSPMIALGVFRSAAFCAVNVLTFLLYFGLSAIFFVLPFNLVQVQGYSATLTGAAYLPFGIILGGLSPRIGTLADRLGVKPLLVAGPLIAGAGMALFAMPGVGGSYWRTFFLPMSIVGLGMACTVTPLTSTAMGSVSVARGGMASAVNNTVARIAGLLAVAAIGVVALPVFTRALDRRLDPLGLEPSLRHALIAERRSFADMTLPDVVGAGERARLEQAIRDAFVESFRWVALICGACALTGGVAMLALPSAAAADDVGKAAAGAAGCTHLDRILAVTPRARGCEECLRSGDSWVHLRLCLSCGHVGCCDSSKNRHATAHFWASRHPIVQSFEPGEDWRWCYIDEAVV